jgi:pre-mRNA 3'-end-processing factor FIP1
VSKAITDVNIDEDLQGHSKPWRNPGSDPSDYFNYGFDEFTWAAYCEKQRTLRADYDPKKMMEEMTKMTQTFMGMPGSGQGGTPQPGAVGPMPGMPNPGDMSQMMAMMPGMEGMPPEMAQMMAQMMASGADPSQMDPSMFAAMQGMGGPPQQQPPQQQPPQQVQRQQQQQQQQQQGQFGGPPPFGGYMGPGQQQQGGYGGYGQNVMQGGGRGRGAGRGRNW